MFIRIIYEFHEDGNSTCIYKDKVLVKRERNIVEAFAYCELKFGVESSSFREDCSFQKNSTNYDSYVYDSSDCIPDQKITDQMEIRPPKVLIFDDFTTCEQAFYFARGLMNNFDQIDESVIQLNNCRIKFTNETSFDRFMNDFTVQAMRRNGHNVDGGFIAYPITKEHQAEIEAEVSEILENIFGTGVSDE